MKRLIADPTVQQLVRLMLVWLMVEFLPLLLVLLVGALPVSRLQVVRLRAWLRQREGQVAPTPLLSKQSGSNTASLSPCRDTLSSQRVVVVQRK
jgi:hypothetical protein